MHGGNIAVLPADSYINEESSMPSSYSITDIGRKREMNQDYIFTSDIPLGIFPNLYIVADGMGGHNAGEFASKYTVERIVQYISESSVTDPQELLDLAIHQANADLRRLAASENKYYGMGTTLVAATILGSRLLAANVGDSRLYILSGYLRQVTVDHSLVEEMVEAGTLSREEARTHPDRNVITRAVGAEDTLAVDYFHEDLKPGDLILMCTDGLTCMVPDTGIEEIIRKREGLSERGADLVRTANDSGGRDNISAILIDPLLNGGIQ